MFIHYPDGITQTGISHQIVSTMDIIPTAIDVTGGKVPEGIDGRSLKPLFHDPDGKAIHDHLTWSGPHFYAQGYMIKKTNRTHYTAGGTSMASWVVVRGDYLLRFTGTMIPGVYLDHINGREPLLELFNEKLITLETALQYATSADEFKLAAQGISSMGERYGPSRLEAA